MRSLSSTTIRNRIMPSGLVGWWAVGGGRWDGLVWRWEISVVVCTSFFASFARVKYLRHSHTTARANSAAAAAQQHSDRIERRRKICFFAA